MVIGVVLARNSTNGSNDRYMHKLLIELERAWCASEILSGSGGGSGSRSGSGSGDGGAGVSHDEERWLAVCFCEFVERALHQLRLHRDLYPVLHHLSLNKLVIFLLRNYNS